jgi:hypothetical protein
MAAMTDLKSVDRNGRVDSNSTAPTKFEYLFLDGEIGSHSGLLSRRL